jgi:hypothetical protein|tara:strand:- start:179 stop:907 length:729 start_codon:yes stop_codon:yes gene_type:complete
MKKIIMDVLEDMSSSQDGQLNLASEVARETTAKLISSTLKSKGSYIVFTDSEIDEQKMKDSWVCSICGENTADVDYDYLGSGTNHLGCELAEGFQEITKDRREKNSSQKKHEDKVFGHDQGGNYEMPEGLKIAKELSQEALKEGIQKQLYTEMTSDGLPEGGDSQAVLESHKLADEIVDNQEGKWIYESPDGGKTVFRRPFGDYDMKNKEEINWETKEPTGRKFTDYPFKVNRGPDRRRAEK